MTQGVYNLQSGDCDFIRNKLLELYPDVYTDQDITDLFNVSPGLIWLHATYDAPVFGQYEYQTVETLEAIYQLTGSRNMGSDITWYVDSFYIGVVPVNITIQNTDGTVENIVYELYTQGLNYNIAFYKCGCNEKEIRCGDCCVNCCEIADMVRLRYENMLL